MHNAAALTASIISLTSALPYIVDTVRGKTHPNVVSWFTWSLVNIISTTAAISTGAWHTAMLTGTIAATCSTIAILGFREGVKRYTSFDVACQVAALLGIVLWRLTKQPDLAVAIAVSINLVAALPTWRHAWIAPFAETWQGFAMGAIASILTLYSIDTYTFISLAAPIGNLFNCAVVVSVILSRRRTSPVPFRARV